MSINLLDGVGGNGMQKTGLPRLCFFFLFFGAFLLHGTSIRLVTSLYTSCQIYVIQKKKTPKGGGGRNLGRRDDMFGV